MIFIKKNKLILISFITVFIITCKKETIERPYGTSIEVPGEVNSLKKAISIAKPYDTILIYPGEYFEWDIEIKKPLFIFSTYINSEDINTINQTIINGNAESRVFKISNITDTVSMKGFTIKRGHAKSKFPEVTEFISYNGGAIYCYNARLKLSDITITNNAASEPNSRGIGGGLYIDSSFIKLNKLRVLNNFAIMTGGAFYCKNSSLEIYNSIIENNTTVHGGPPIDIRSSKLYFKDVLFKDSINDIERNPDVIFSSSVGIFKEVKSINDSVYIENSSIQLINCDMPGLMETKYF